VVLQRFTSGLYIINGVDGPVADIPHGLPTTPGHVRWVLVNQTADIGYSPGDEVDVAGVDANQYPAYTWGANTTNVFLIRSDAGFFMKNKGNGFRSGANDGRWQAKCYAEP
jgi:hypothetical protein